MITTEKVYESVKNKRWTKRACDHSHVSHVASVLGLPHTIAEILSRKNVCSSELHHYLDPKLKHLMPNPSHLIDMDIAIELTMHAIEMNKKIAVLADYDVDGATSSALLAKFFKHLNRDITIYIPDRIKEGYGPNVGAITQLKGEGVELLITVDCGSTSFEAIAHAKMLGLQVIVLDHHMCGAELPVADALVNPNRLDETSSYKYLCAAGLTFLFVAKLSRMLASDFDMFSVLDLVALGTVCDVVPMVGLNRAYVKHGLKVIEARTNLGVKALLDSACIKELVSTYHLGFMLGPRINAGGRVGSTKLGSELLKCDLPELAISIAAELELHNHERKVVESHVLKEAMLQAEQIHHKSPIVLVHADSWHVGVIGIVAARLVDKFQKPAAVIAFDEDGVGKASCRSIPEVDFGHAVIKAKEKGLLVAGGGHAMAAGFTVMRDKLEELRAFFKEFFQAQVDLAQKNKTNHYDADITINSPTVEFINQVERLGPFGSQNYQPRFMLHNVSVVNAKVLKGEHVSCMLTEFGKGASRGALRGIAFGAISSPLGEVLLADRYNLNLIVSLGLNTWQGVTTANLVIHDAIISNRG